MANKIWNDVSGDWDVPGDWGPTPGIPAASDVAIFNSASAYVVSIGTAGGAVESELVAGVTLADGQAVLDVTAGSTIAVTGAIDLAAGTLVLAGLQHGGTLEGNGGFLQLAGGTLDGVTFQGVLNYGTAEYVTLAIRDGLTVRNAQGGAGTIVMGGLSDALDVLDSETLGPLVLDMAQTYQSVVAETPTLTLAAGFTLAAGGAQDFIQAATLINRGSIGVAGSLATFDIDTATLVNSGTISAGAGAVVAIDTSPLYGGGQGQLLSLSGGGTFALANGSTLVLGADQTTAQLLAIVGTSTGVHTIVLGTLDNHGTVLDVAAGTPLAGLTLAADVIGGTIINAGSLNAGSLVVGNSTFQGVTFGGVLNLASDQVTFTQGATFLPGSTVDFTGSDYITIADTETLNGTVFDIAGGAQITAATDTLTFGAGLTVNVTAGGAQIFAQTGLLTNAGTIAVTGTGASLALVVATLVNSGTIAVGAGAALTINEAVYQYPPFDLSDTGTFALAGGSALTLDANFTTAQVKTILGTSTGVLVTIENTLVNTGTVLATGTTGPFGHVTLDADVIGGTIVDGGGTLVVAGGELQGVTFAGPLDFAAGGNVYLRVAQGITLENASGGAGGTVNIDSSYDTLAILDSETLTGAMITIAGSYDSISGSTLGLGAGLTLDVTGEVAAISAATLTNAGTIAVTGANDSLALETATLANSGTITVAAGAALSIGAGGQTLDLTGTGAIKLAGGSSLALNADQSTAQLLSVLGTATGVFVSVSGTLFNSGTALHVGAGGSVASLTLGADVIGGTIINAGSVTVDSSTFQGVTFAGPLNLAAGNDQLTILNGLTLESAAGGAGGTINALTYFDTINVADTETLNGAVINLSGYGDAIDGSTLTFGSGLTVRGTDLASVNVGTLNAAGTILVTGNASSLTLNDGTLANTGLMAVSGNAASLIVDSTTLSNSGTMTVAGIGAALVLDSATVANSGVIAVGAQAGLKIGVNGSGGALAQTLSLTNTGSFEFASGAALTFGADETTAQLLSVLGTATGVAVTVLGTLFNAGTSLDVTASGPLSELALQADVIGGTIVDAGGALTVGSGELQGVTFAGPLDLAPGGNVLLAIAGGLTLESAAGTPGGTINMVSNDDTIDVLDTETLNGAVVNIAGTGEVIESTTLTLGAGLTLDVTGAATVQAGSLTNAGTILAAGGGFVDLQFTTFANHGTVAVAAGGTLAINTTGIAQALSLANSGAISLAAGSTLELGGIETTAQLLALVNNQPGVALELVGTLINTGTSIVLGSGLLGHVVLDADVIGGTIVAGPSLTVSGGTLTGVTVDGSLALAGYDETLTVIGGLTLASAAGALPGTLDLAGSDNTVVIGDAETLDQAFVAMSGAGDELAAAGGTLLFGAHLTLDATGLEYLGASTLANAGTILVGGTGSVLDIAGPVVTGSGIISVGSGDVLGLDAGRYAYQEALGGSLSVANRLVLSGATLALGGTATAAQLSTLLAASSGASVIEFSTLLATGATLDLSATGSLAALADSGNIIGGTFIDGDGSLALANGTVDGVTIDGALTLTGYEDFIEGGLRFAGANGSGIGTMVAAGADYLYFADSETLANVLVNIATADLLLIAETPTLTLAASATLSVGAIATFSATTVVNAGTITAAGQGAAVVIESGTIVNATSGIIAVGSGDLLAIDADVYYDGYTGGYAASALDNPLDLINSGAISVAPGGTLVVGSTETTAKLVALVGSIAPTGVQVEVVGTLINTGATLAIGSAGLTNVVLDADVVGGVIAETGGSLEVTGGTLDGVTFQGPLDLTQNNVDLTVQDGLTFASAGTIAVTGTAEVIGFADNETLNGVFITIAPPPLHYNGGYYYAGDTPGLTISSNVGSLALGAGVTVVSNGNLLVSTGTAIASAADILVAAGTAELNAETIINTGTVNVLSGSELELIGAGYGVTLDIANLNSIDLAAGSTLLVDGTISTAALLALVDAGSRSGVEVILEGVLLNAGATLDIAPGPLGDVVLDNTIIGGTVVNGGSLLTFQTVDFQSVTFVGPLVLGDEDVLDVTGGLSVLNPVAALPGSIALTSYESTINFGDSETLDTIVLSAGAGASGTLSDSGTLTFGPHVDVAITGGLLVTGGALVNDGIIALTGPSAAFTIDSGTFVNNGIITVASGDLLALNLAPQSTTGLALYGAGSFVLAPGATLGVGGAVTALQLTTLLASINANGAAIELDGTLLNTGTVFSSVAGTDLADVVINGDVVGGTLTAGTGTLSIAHATFTGVTYQGPLTIGGGESLAIQNGVTLTGTAGTGPGMLSLGEDSTLDFLDNETLANALVTLGTSAFFAEINFQSLTLAASATVAVASSDAYLSGYSLVNDGTLVATGTNANLTIESPNVTNDGIITVGSGDVLDISGIYDNGYATYIYPITYGGSGTVNLAPGSTLVIDGDETTAQALALAGSIVGNQPGVTVEFEGYIANTGSSLAFEPGGSLGNVELSANITGGSIINASGSVSVSGGELDGVAFQGALALGDGFLNIVNGLTVSAIGGGLGTLIAGGSNTPGVEGSVSTLNLEGTGQQTLGNLLITGSGGIEIEAQGVLNSSYQLAVPGILDIAANVTADIGGLLTLSGNGGGTVVNAGTLLAMTQGSGIVLDGNTVVNLGTIVVDAGAVLGIAATGSLSLTNGPGGVISIASGATLVLGGSLTPTGLEALVGSLVTNPGVTVGFGGLGYNESVLSVDGTFVIPPTGSLSSFIFDEAEVVGGAAGGTVDGAGTVSFAGYDLLDNLTYVGSITSTAPNTYLELAGSTSLLSSTTGPELISLLGTESGLELASTQLAGTDRAAASHVEIDNAVIDLGAAAATLSGYAYGDQLEVYGGTLTFGATTTVDANSGFAAYVDANAETGGMLVNDGTILATGGSVTVETYSDYLAGNTPNDFGVFVNNGQFIAGPGTAALPAGSVALTMTGSVINAGTIAVSGADSFVVDSASFANSGLVALSAGATLDFSAAPVAAGTILLADGAETLQIDSAGRVDSAGAFAATLLDFSVGDTIDLTSLAPGAGTLAYANNVLDVNEGAVTVATISLPTYPYAPGSFALTPDAAGTGSAITTSQTLATAPCFHAGTRIRTIAGDVAVEHLVVGDMVVTAAGKTRPVIWIGQRRIDCARHPRPHLVLPIRVRQGAFGDGLPSRDLVLSPDHSLYVDGVLIPVQHLLNGATILRERVPAVHYFHVELSGHDVLFAEGLPAESYLDTGNRASFANGCAHLSLHPDFAPLGWEDACAPLCQDGPIVAAARRRLLARAAALGYRRAGRIAPVVMAGDRVIRAASAVGGVHRFLLPAQTGNVRIVSGTGVAEGAGCRECGVVVGGIVAHGRAVALDSPALGRGFYPIETWDAGPGRWTNGEAWLALDRRAAPGVLELRLINTVARRPPPASTLTINACASL